MSLTKLAKIVIIKLSIFLIVVFLLFVFGLQFIGVNVFDRRLLPSSPLPGEDLSGSGYFKHLDRVYWQLGGLGSSKEYLPDVDMATFIVFPGSNYAKDKNHVYIYALASSVVKDVSSFQQIQPTRNQYYFKDKQNVYYNNDSFLRPTDFSIIGGADPDTFEILTDANGQPWWFARDGHNIYCNGKRLKTADYDTFALKNDVAGDFEYAVDAYYAYGPTEDSKDAGCGVFPIPE